MVFQTTNAISIKLRQNDGSVYYCLMVCSMFSKIATRSAGVNKFFSEIICELQIGLVFLKGFLMSVC